MFCLLMRHVWRLSQCSLSSSIYLKSERRRGRSKRTSVSIIDHVSTWEVMWSVRNPIRQIRGTAPKKLIISMRAERTSLSLSSNNSNKNKNSSQIRINVYNCFICLIISREIHINHWVTDVFFSRFLSSEIQSLFTSVAFFSMS